jgi:hypothetical protein
MIRIAAIALLLTAPAVAADSGHNDNPFSGARSMKIAMHKEHHRSRCTANWWADLPDHYWLICKGKR